MRAFLRANGFFVTVPFGVVLGVVLNLVSNTRVGVPTIPNAVLIGQLVPSIVTLLLAWTLSDRWSSPDWAPQRSRFALSWRRELATTVTCLMAGGLAGLGTGWTTMSTTMWFVSLALLGHALVGPYWWVPIMATQFVLLRTYFAAPVLREFIGQPAPATFALGLCAAAALAPALINDQVLRRPL